MPILGLIASSALKGLTTFIDNFNRTTSGSLGTSSSGDLWSAIRGVWSANGTVAISSDNVNTYPLAAVTMSSPNKSMKVDTSMGVGLAFWVSGAGDWWATVPISTSASETYSTCVSNSCCTGSPGGCVANSCCTGSPPQCVYNACCSQGASTTDCSAYSSCCSGFGAYGVNGQCYSELDNFNVGPGTIVAGPCIASSCCTTTADTCVSNSCCSVAPNTCVSNSCCTGSDNNTRTRYYWILRVLKAISGVFTVVSDTAISNSLTNTNLILSVSSETSGNTLVAKAYSNTGAVTQTGSTVTITNTDPKGNGFGIIKTQSSNNQGSTADNLTIN
jgi:hypothetical protein